MSKYTIEKYSDPKGTKRWEIINNLKEQQHKYIKL
jgi:hypothetical protein